MTNVLTEQSNVTDNPGCPASNNLMSWFTGFKENASRYYDDAKAKFGAMFQGGAQTRAQQRMRMQMRMMRGGRTMRGGGYARPYYSLTNLASHGAPINGIKSAAPHNWTRGGGKRRRRHRKKTMRKRY